MKPNKRDNKLPLELQIDRKHKLKRCNSPFFIEAKATSEAVKRWESWGIIAAKLFAEKRDWHIYKKYVSKKARDEAYANILKKQMACRITYPYSSYDFRIGIPNA